MCRVQRGKDILESGLRLGRSIGNQIKTIGNLTESTVGGHPVELLLVTEKIGPADRSGKEGFE